MSNEQVTSLLPEFMAPESEHDKFITVPESTGNCVVVSSVLFQSVFSPVQSVYWIQNVSIFILQNMYSSGIK